MEIILLENIENLGSLGDKVNVKAGFARNFLVPHGKAKMATVANLAEFEERRADLEKAAAEAKAAAQSRVASFDALATIEIHARVGSEGKLFGSIGITDVFEAVHATKVGIEKREIRMPEGAIRTTGEHKIDIHLYSGIDTTVTLNILAEE